MAADFDLPALLQALQRDPRQRDELRRALLGEAGDLVESMARQAAAGARTDEHLESLARHVDELAAAQRRTEERVEELAAAQRRTEERLDGLIEQVSELVTTTAP